MCRIKNRPKSDQIETRIISIVLSEVARMFFSRHGVLVNLQKPRWNVSAGSSRSSLSILMCQNPQLLYSVEKTVASFRLLIPLSMRGTGYKSRIVTPLNLR